MEYGIILHIRKGENVCGDGYVIREFENAVLMGVMDGMGWGAKPRETVLRVKRFLRDHAKPDNHHFPDLIQGIHSMMVGTEGVAIALIWIDLKENILYFTGVGGPGAKVMSTKIVEFNTCSGIVGCKVEGIRIEKYEYRPGDRIALYTEGISHRFTFADPNINIMQDVQGIAQQIGEIYGNEKDDYALIVAYDPLREDENGDVINEFLGE